MSKENKGGRPSKMTSEVLAKLEHSFSLGLSDREACLYAEIDPATLYRYCEKHQEFYKRKELLKERPVMRAKIVVCDAIEAGDLKASQWYLERKAKEEFSPKQEQSISLASPVTIIDDLGGDE